MGYNAADLKELIGKTVVEVQGLNELSDELIFVCDDGTRYKMYHSQDCCENVSLVDIVGDKEHLIGLVIDAREETSGESPRGHESLTSESQTWTFYLFQTENGAVTLRWQGTSNGYYSESVQFVRITKEK